MKKSFVISVQETRFNAVAFKSNLAMNLRQISRLGYDGVELAIRNPEEVEGEQIIALCRENGLPIVAIGTGQAWGEERLSLTDPRPNIRKKTVNRLKQHILFAAPSRAKVIIGLIRGMSRPEVSPDQTREWLLEGIGECADFAKDFKDVFLAVELINRYETNLLNTVREGLDFLNLLQRENVGLLVDTFHMNIEEADIQKSIRSAEAKINHVHFADSNRWAPGWGHLNFKAVMDALYAIDYSGYVSAEIMPKPTIESCAEETIQYLNQLGL